MSTSQTIVLPGIPSENGNTFDSIIPLDAEPETETLPDRSPRSSRSSPPSQYLLHFLRTFPVIKNYYYKKQPIPHYTTNFNRNNYILFQIQCRELSESAIKINKDLRKAHKFLLCQKNINLTSVYFLLYTERSLSMVSQT